MQRERKKKIMKVLPAELRLSCFVITLVTKYLLKIRDLFFSLEICTYHAIALILRDSSGVSRDETKKKNKKERNRNQQYPLDWRILIPSSPS